MTQPWLKRALAASLVLTACGALVLTRARASRAVGLDALSGLEVAGGGARSLEEVSRGRTLVIYFGYTTCWRSCPTALNSIAAAMDDLPRQEASSVQPLFVDMDPDRTTRQILREYMAAFGPEFVGLTGTEAETEAAANNFGVTVQKIRFSADPTDYAMKHTSPIIVMNIGLGQKVELPAASSSEAIKAAIHRVAITRGDVT